MPEFWEQQPDEPENAFRAFLVYRELVPPRSVTAAFREWKKEPGL